MDSNVYEAVSERAADRCENCMHPFGSSLKDRPELDHVFGRARSETVSTCWMLCGACHVAKTRNDPSAAYWLVRFIAHCLKHGHLEALDVALRNLEFKVVRSSL